MWRLLGYACIAGALGGLVKPLVVQTSYVMPAFESGIFIPGFLGNVIVGCVAAGLFWLLSGPDPSANPPPGPREIGKGLAGAFLISLSGAGWLSSESEKSLYKGTAIAAAHNDGDLPRTIEAGHPAQALRAAQQVADADFQSRAASANP